MNNLKEIPVNDFMPRINHLWKDEWFLLTSGDYSANHYNTMTVAWGYFGIMWNKPVAVVVVRPTRFTFEFMNQYETFTLSAFAEGYKKELNLLGTKSGREGDKIAETGLSVIPSQKIPAPSFREATLIVECKKIYWEDFKPDRFLDKSIDKNYPQKDYHRMFFGKIVYIRGEGQYRTANEP